MKQHSGFLIAIAAVSLWIPAPMFAGQNAAPGAEQQTSKQMKGATAEEIRPTVKEAIDHAKKGVEAGEKDDAPALVAHAEKALAKAKQAQAAGLNEYLNGGTSELGEAIEHGRTKHTKDATEHMRRAIMRLSQAADVQVPK